MGAVFGSQSASDCVVSISAVVGSEVISSPSGEARRVAYNVSGVPSFTVSAGDPSDDLGLNDGESADETDVFSALGMIGRPIDPEESSGPAGNKYAEAVCVKEQDTLVPVSYRDLRLKMGGNAPLEGQLAFVGYGGGFISQSAVDTSNLDDGTIQTIYCPYDFVGGVAQKAHTITLDPSSGNESISIVHADGMAIFLQSDGSIQIQTDGVPSGTGSTVQQSYLKLEPGKITMNADQLVLNGTVYVGDPNLGVVMTPGAASPPCPRLFLSPSV